ncbi:uncharacterized protein LOC122850420 [Aphidius gifuensis]|uniref:uncharacterized protein LOC122850420 n=1 Tax=Aphidius gifuensis TaxID=684658 RepID=UPI001CDCAF4C|nr:uncharacterized protein LOC122850420 [Aphidius gifuensis]
MKEGHFHSSSSNILTIAKMIKEIKEAAKSPGTPQVIYDRIVPINRDAARFIALQRAAYIITQERKSYWITPDKETLESLATKLKEHHQFRDYFQELLFPATNQEGTILVFGDKNVIQRINNAKAFYIDADCCQINVARMIMPKEDDNILKFKNHRYKELVPFVIYADLECILKSIDKTESNEHIPHSAAYSFLPSSIDKLSSDLSNDQKIITRSECNNGFFDLLCRKGVFPYEFIDSWEKLDEKALPSKKEFFSKLNNSDISNADYEHAKNIWEKFEIKTLGEYPNLYLKTDVLLLTDIFENFRLSCLLTYSLDALHYFTAPGLAFDAMLKYTGVKLELLTDPAMHLFIEKGIQGGVAQCMNRYAKANNRYMDNLNIDVTKISDEAEIGYILEVDLEYLKNLHHYHKNLPLCPELNLGLGMKLNKIYRVLKFQQSPWLKKYIDLNTGMRQQATTDFGKNFFKLMNNSVYGKTMQNVRKEKDVKLVTKWEGRYGAKSLIAKPNFHSCSIYKDDLQLLKCEELK